MLCTVVRSRSSFPQAECQDSCSTGTITSSVSTSAKTAVPWTTTVRNPLKPTSTSTDKSIRLQRPLLVLPQASQLARVLSATSKLAQIATLLHIHNLLAELQSNRQQGWCVRNLLTRLCALNTLTTILYHSLRLSRLHLSLQASSSILQLCTPHALMQTLVSTATRSTRTSSGVLQEVRGKLKVFSNRKAEDLATLMDSETRAPSVWLAPMTLWKPT